MVKQRTQFKCSKCSQVFPKLSDLSAHARETHGAKVGRPKKPDEPQPEEAEVLAEAGETPAPIPASFTVSTEARDPATMPDLSAQPASTPPSAATAYNAPPPPPTPAPPPPPFACRPLVDLIAHSFNKSIEKAAADPHQEKRHVPGPPDPISRDDCEALASALEPLAAKYLPKMAPYMVELNAAIVVASIFGPRLWQARQHALYLRELRLQAKAAQTAHAAPAAQAVAPPPPDLPTAATNGYAGLYERQRRPVETPGDLR